MTLMLSHLFYLVGALLAAISIMTFLDKNHPKRFLSGTFWGLYALVFLIGDFIPPMWVGVGVVLIGLIGGLNLVGSGNHHIPSTAEFVASAKRLGSKLFIPALAIPFLTMVGTLLAPYLVINDTTLIEQRNATLISLCIGCIVAFGLACGLTRETPVQGIREARRLVDCVGWALVLPQMLGMLGLVFSDAGVGKAVAHLTTNYINMDYRFVAVAIYVVGMALFTVIMGNGFAAFPVMTGGIGVPILIGVYGGNPAIIAAVGMLSGYCGTLMTPMAANFNIVPAALLELPDKNAVIRVQIPTAFMLLAANVVILYLLMGF